MRESYHGFLRHWISDDKEVNFSFSPGFSLGSCASSDERTVSTVFRKCTHIWQLKVETVKTGNDILNNSTLSLCQRSQNYSPTRCE